MTSQAISTFNFHNHPVRVETVNDEPMFCLKDVTRILGIQNNKVRRFKLNDNGVHKMYLTDNLGRQQQVTFINEPNLYRVIFRSNKAEAVKFQNWVFEQVLPQIRQTGQYGDTSHLAEQNQALKTALLKNNQDYQTIKVMYDGGLQNWQIKMATNLSKSSVEKRLRIMKKLGLISHKRGTANPQTPQSQQLTLGV